MGTTIVADIRQGRGPKKQRFVLCACCETKPDIDLSSPQVLEPEAPRRKAKEPPVVPPLNLDRLHKPARPANILQ